MMKTKTTMITPIVIIYFILTLTMTAPGADDDFHLKVTPPTRTIDAGDSTHYQVTVQFKGNYDRPVSLEVSGLPDGASGNFTVNPIVRTGNGRTKLEIQTDPSTPCGTYTLTITGREQDGGITHTFNVTLIIENCGGTKPEPDFQLKVEPLSRTLYRGERTEYTVTVTGQNGFSESVSLRLTGAPAGTAATFSQPAITPNGNTQLIIATSGQTPLGSHTLTVIGTGGGKQHTADVELILICRDFTARVEVQPERGAAPLSVQFAGNVDVDGGGIIDPSEYIYSWTFGDGGTANIQNPVHTYQAPGIYNAGLTITDACGQSRTASVVIEAEGFEGRIGKSFSVSRAMPGDTVFITINAVNDTHMDFKNIVIRDDLSPHLEYLDDDAPVPVDRKGQELVWRLPLLKKRGTLSFRIKVKIAESAPAGVITNTAFLSHDSLGEGRRITSNTASLTIDTLAVRLVKQVEQTSAQPGDTINYRLIVKNDSTVPLTGVKLSDRLSSHLEFVSAASVEGLTLQRQGKRLNWQGTLAAHRQVELNFSARIGRGVFSGTVITNSAVLEAVELKETIQSNMVHTMIDAHPINAAKVRFRKRSEVPQTEIGRIIRFALTITNNSNAAVLNPVIEDHLPQGFSYVPSSVLLNNRRYSEPAGNRRLQWQLEAIAPGETKELRYQVVIGGDVRRGKNVNRATLRAVDNSGQDIFLEASAFVNVSTAGLIFYSSLEGTVYLDRNGDDFYNPPDTPLEGIEVRMSSGEKAFTDGMGHYSFENLFPGEYAVAVNRAALPDRYRLSTPYPRIVVLTDGLSDVADFAVKFKNEDDTKTARLQGRVFLDKNPNRAYDDEDVLLQEFQAVLDGRLITNGENGVFVFSHIEPGAHTIEVRYDGKRETKEIKIKRGNNQIDIPLKFTGILITITSEK